MKYPNTQRGSIFDLSKFGMPNDLTNLKLPALGKYNIDPSAQYFTGGMDASSLGFGQFRGLPTIILTLCQITRWILFLVNH